MENTNTKDLEEKLAAAAKFNSPYACVDGSWFRKKPTVELVASIDIPWDWSHETKGNVKDEHAADMVAMLMLTGRVGRVKSAKNQHGTKYELHIIDIEAEERYGLRRDNVRRYAGRLATYFESNGGEVKKLLVTQYIQDFLRLDTCRLLEETGADDF